MEYESFNEFDKKQSLGKIGENSYEMSPSCGNICDCACFCNCFDYNQKSFEQFDSNEGSLETSLLN